MKIWFLSLFMVFSIGNAQHSMGHMANTDLENLEGDAFEIAFLSGMIAHHEGAVVMAQWILELGQLPVIASSAEQIIAAQEPEIKLMQSWLEEWYGGTTDEAASMMMANDMEAMMSAMNAGENADIAFLNGMSLHHDSAIDMAQLALHKAKHPELRELATRIIGNQAQEIADYQKTLRELEGR